MVHGPLILDMEALAGQNHDLTVRKTKISIFSEKFICVKRLSHFMTRPLSNIKFKQK